MNASTGTMTCPKGHISAEPDYCSECGAKIQGATRARGLSAFPQAEAAEVCPDCGSAREQKEIAFCEVCGYNFITGAHGEVPVAPSTAPASSAMPSEQKEEEPVPESSATVQGWTVTVSVDPSLRTPESPEAPPGIAPFEVILHAPVSLIGRHNEAKGIVPEIALDHDEAVSRRHALLQIDPQRGLQLRDIGAANGTRLNGNDLQPMTDYPVKDGDEITLGHWSRLKLQGR